MAIQRTANQPITFPDQISAYGAGVANTSQSSIIIETANVPVNFSNSQGTVQYTPSTGTPVTYTTV
jgi:hypothetical protein